MFSAELGRLWQFFLHRASRLCKVSTGVPQSSGLLAEPLFMRQSVSSCSSLSHDSKTETFLSSCLFSSSFSFSPSAACARQIPPTQTLKLSFICLLSSLDKLSCRAGLEFMTRWEGSPGFAAFTSQRTGLQRWGRHRASLEDFSSCHRVWN